jgi:hypothetical protein
MFRNFVVLFLTGLIFISLRYLARAEDVLIFTTPQEEWNPPSAGPVTTWTAPLCGKGKFVIQPLLFYNNTRGSFDAKGNYSSMTESESNFNIRNNYLCSMGLAID